MLTFLVYIHSVSTVTLFSHLHAHKLHLLYFTPRPVHTPSVFLLFTITTDMPQSQPAPCG